VESTAGDLLNFDPFNVPVVAPPKPRRYISAQVRRFAISARHAEISLTSTLAPQPCSHQQAFDIAPKVFEAVKKGDCLELAALIARGADLALHDEAPQVRV
jgi:hypothetical protein